MKRITSLAALTLFLAAAAPLRANEIVAKPIKTATPKATATPRSTATPTEKKATKTRHTFFNPDDLHKDRSLPAGDKVPTTIDDGQQKDPPYKHLNTDLHKDRG